MRKANEEQKTTTAAENQAGLFERKPWLSTLLRVLVVLAVIGELFSGGRAASMRILTTPRSMATSIPSAPASRDT